MGFSIIINKNKKEQYFSALQNFYFTYIFYIALFDSLQVGSFYNYIIKIYKEFFTKNYLTSTISPRTGKIALNNDFVYGCFAFSEICPPSITSTTSP